MEFKKSGSFISYSLPAEEKILRLQNEITRLKEYEYIVKGFYEDGNICFAIFQGVPPSIVFVNRGLEKITGYSREEMLNFVYPDIERIIYPDVRDEFFSSYRKIFTGEEFSGDFEFKIFGKEGAVIVLQTHLYRIEYNSHPAVVMTVADITTIKEAGKALRESREKYRLLFNKSPVSIFYYDKNLLINHFNERFIELLQSKRELLWRYDLHSVKEKSVLPCIESVLRGKNGFYKGPYRLLAGESEIFISMKTEPLFNDAGEVTGGVGIIEDLTRTQEAEDALVRSEENFKEMIDRSPLAIAVIEKSGDIMYNNRECYKLFGFLSDKKMNIADWFNDVYPDPVYREAVRMEWYNDYIDSQKTRKTIGPKEYKVMCFDGNVRNIEFHMVPVGDMNFLVMNDMTRHRKAEEELLKTKKIESLGIMAGGIAHDFNNILTAVIGNLNLAKLDVADRLDVYALLESIEKAAWRARDLTQQLLTFSTGGEPVRKASSVKGILSDLLLPVLSGTDIKTEVNLADDLMEADIDEGQIIQALYNIINNSKEAMSGKGLIRVAALNYRNNNDTNLKPDWQYVKIIFEDTGGGIAQSDLPNIFDPFFTTRESSSGLGLTVAYSIVKKHGGDIKVSTNPGAGTIVEVLLPACRDVVSEQYVSEPTEYSYTGKILIMDDEEIILEIMRKMLTRLGYDITLSRDGEEAITLYKDADLNGHPFDCVIMDLSIPEGMGGKETIEKLREYDPGVKAIVSSGYSNDPIMSRYQEYGFLGVSVKPYSFDDLRKEIERVITSGSTH